MDLFARSRRLLLIGTTAALAASCAQKAGKPVGTSTAGHPMTAPAQDGGAVPAEAGIPPDFESSFVKMNQARFVSNGHAAGRWDVDVYANDAAKEAFLAEREPVPAGAKLVKVHYERAADRKRGPIMMMEKREAGYDPEHGDWRYVVVASNGELVREGKIEGCAGCHDDAPHDHLFRMRE